MKRIRYHIVVLKILKSILHSASRGKTLILLLRSLHKFKFMISKEGSIKKGRK
jgi:hypothetical protein